jgi:hypothetical protein
MIDSPNQIVYTCGHDADSTDRNSDSTDHDCDRRISMMAVTVIRLIFCSNQSLGPVVTGSESFSCMDHNGHDH